MHCADRIKLERERLGYNQTAFAEIAGATRKTLFNWETGVGSPNADALAAWSALGLDVLYVVTGERAQPVTQQLPADEQMWLDCYRGWEMPVKRKELARALGLSPTDASEGPQVVTTGHVGGAYSQHNVGDHAVQIGRGGNSKVTIKKGR